MWQYWSCDKVQSENLQESKIKLFYVPNLRQLFLKYVHHLTINCTDHYNDVIMSAIACQINSLTIVYSTFYLDADQRTHQSSASPAFLRGIHRGPVNSPCKWPVTRKMFPFDDVIMHFILWHGTGKCICILCKMYLYMLVDARWQGGSIFTRLRLYIHVNDTHPNWPLLNVLT